MADSRQLLSEVIRDCVEATRKNRQYIPATTIDMCNEIISVYTEYSVAIGQGSKLISHGLEVFDLNINNILIETPALCLNMFKMYEKLNEELGITIIDADKRVTGKTLMSYVGSYKFNSAKLFCSNITNIPIDWGKSENNYQSDFEYITNKIKGWGSNFQKWFFGWALCKGAIIMTKSFAYTYLLGLLKAIKKSGNKINQTTLLDCIKSEYDNNQTRINEMIRLVSESFDDIFKSKGNSVSELEQSFLNSIQEEEYYLNFLKDYERDQIKDILRKSVTLPSFESCVLSEHIALLLDNICVSDSKYSLKTIYHILKSKNTIIRYWHELISKMDINFDELKYLDSYKIADIYHDYIVSERPIRNELMNDNLCMPYPLSPIVQSFDALFDTMSIIDDDRVNTHLLKFRSYKILLVLKMSSDIIDSSGLSSDDKERFKISIIPLALAIGICFFSGETYLCPISSYYFQKTVSCCYSIKSLISDLCEYGFTHLKPIECGKYQLDDFAELQFIVFFRKWADLLINQLDCINCEVDITQMENMMFTYNPSFETFNYVNRYAEIF